ncbi:5-oxoprolinase subunit PxpB [Dethiobacter alkaliphilus]|uniref:Allophanate hydrolase subunit 1 n=1 Tax=Dethiobacter alkaliphilus AHT 1 TaxID=555088 RepID=C0GH21_DETAL|nr:5-oxoprolinase subunit PxpB [Dethiobacter alkaliphilus]EEG77323.1 Allophanate hydrolase subunit 1 [Dethiobacter alkaliphilus AHT 1]
MAAIKFRPAGDSALAVEFGETIDEQTNQKVRNMYYALQNLKLPGVVETVPTYRSLLVYFDPLQQVPERLAEELLRVEMEMDSVPLPPPVLFHVPVLYGGDVGPDLAFVAEHAGLSEEEVIKIHTAKRYRIYMLGFTPGFCYLGGMAKQLATPRLSVPRTKIPAGSVGIAGEQTGIYPMDSPGGWQLIGRTPLRLFAPLSKTPFLFSAGNYLRFFSVDACEYRRIEELCAQGKYQPQAEVFADGGS